MGRLWRGATGSPTRPRSAAKITRHPQPSQAVLAGRLPLTRQCPRRVRPRPSSARVHRRVAKGRFASPQACRCAVAALHQAKRSSSAGRRRDRCGTAWAPCATRNAGGLETLLHLYTAEDLPLDGAVDDLRSVGPSGNCGREGKALSSCCDPGGVARGRLVPPSDPLDAATEVTRPRLTRMGLHTAEV